MRIFGVWLYGAISILMLAFAGFFYGDNSVIFLVIASSGFAYVAEFSAHRYDIGHRDFLSEINGAFVYASVLCGVISFILLVVNNVRF